MRQLRSYRFCYDVFLLVEEAELDICAAFFDRDADGIGHADSRDAGHDAIPPCAQD